MGFCTDARAMFLFIEESILASSVTSGIKIIANRKKTKKRESNVNAAEIEPDIFNLPKKLLMGCPISDKIPAINM